MKPSSSTLSVVEHLERAADPDARYRIEARKPFRRIDSLTRRIIVRYVEIMAGPGVLTRAEIDERYPTYCELLSGDWIETIRNASNLKSHFTDIMFLHIAWLEDELDRLSRFRQGQ